MYRYNINFGNHTITEWFYLTLLIFFVLILIDKIKKRYF